MAVKRFQDQLKSKKKKKRFAKLAVGGAAIFLLAIGAVYFLFYSGKFKVREIEINAPETAQPAEIKKAVENWLNQGKFGWKRGNNYYFLPAEKLNALLLAQFKNIDAVTVGKLKNKLRIAVTERIPRGIWCIAKTDHCYFFDKKSVAYEASGSSEGYIYVLIKDFQKDKLELGQTVADGSLINSIFNLRDLLARKDIRVAWFELPAEPADELWAITSEGWRLLMMQKADFNKPVENLVIFMKTKLPVEDRAKLDYIDLRIEDRIYYKIKTAPVQ